MTDMILHNAYHNMLMRLKVNVRETIGSQLIHSDSQQKNNGQERHTPPRLSKGLK